VGSFRKLCEILIEGGQITVKHGHLALKSYSPKISARQMKQMDELMNTLIQHGVSAPAQGNLINDMGIAPTDLKLFLKLLSEEGKIRMFGKNIVLTDVLENCRSKLLEMFEAKPEIEVREFRDETGLGRTLAVAMLEHFDNEGMTQRKDNTRILVRKPINNS
jgi:hypothetical protein